MSRRAARVTQADVARVIRAAQAAGPAWRVEVLPDGVIRAVQGEAPKSEPLPAPENFGRGLEVVP